MLNAKNGRITIDGGNMEYVCFGSGKDSLVILPGLGDGLRSVRGTALPMAIMYRALAKDFTVYVFSRIDPLPAVCSTRDMASAQKRAMDELGIEKASILGVSMGGMIAQWLACDYPQSVDKLVLAVSSPKPNPILTQSVTGWMELARQGNFIGLMDSNLRLIYSDGYYKKNRRFIQLIAKRMAPKSYERFLTMAQACLEHDASPALKGIKAPCLAVGGWQDRTLGGEATVELASAIPGCKLYMYQNYGHGLYEEARDFLPLVLGFLKA